jgi:hypothetical protein
MLKFVGTGDGRTAQDGSRRRMTGRRRQDLDLGVPGSSTVVMSDGGLDLESGSLDGSVASPDGSVARRAERGLTRAGGRVGENGGTGRRGIDRG